MMIKGETLMPTQLTTPELNHCLEYIDCASHEQIQHMYTALHIRNQALQARAMRGLCVGDRVSFTDRKGFKHFGKITKINRKNAKILEEVRNVQWTVAGTLLKLED